MSRDLSMFKYSMPTVGGLALRSLREKYNFQDLQSIILFFKDILEIDLRLDKDQKEKIILYQALRHIIMHNSALVDHKFLTQIRNTNYSNSYFDKDLVQITNEQYLEDAILYMYIFLDESGQFTKHNSEEYFIVGSFTIGDKNRTNKRFRSWHKTRFPKKMRNQPEIKFSEVKIDPKLRLRTLKYISDLDVRIHYSYLLRKNIPDIYKNKNKLESGRLYTNIIGETLEMYLPTNDLEFRVFCDERHLKGIRRSEFKSILKNRLAPQLPAGTVIQIEMINSISDANIQIADWIAGSLAWYLEGKELGEECLNILKNNLLEDGKELFKNHWDKKYSK